MNNTPTTPTTTPNIDLNQFKHILKLDSLDLLGYASKILQKHNYNTHKWKCADYLYCEGNIPILLVAHVDTVHKTLPNKIYYDHSEKVLWSPDGIGGDDRCGVYAILHLISDNDKLKPHILFTNYEEIGGLGARQFIDDYPDIPNINFIIEIDRHGCNDAVFYECGNIDFQDYILNFGFASNHGTFSDISILSPSWNVASVNLSSGYYHEHTYSEYIKLKHLTSTINKIKRILLDNIQHSTHYDYQEITYQYKNVYKWSGTKWDYNDYTHYDDIEDTLTTPTTPNTPTTISNKINGITEWNKTGALMSRKKDNTNSK